MKFYGKGTKWCIAGNYPGYIGKGQGFFDDYKNRRYTDYYVVINREGPEGNNKWCVCPLQEDPANKCDIWNAPDNQVSCIPGAPNIPGIPPVSSMTVIDGVLVKVRDGGIVVETKIPENVVKIGRKACFGLRTEKIIIPDGVVEIDSGAFATSRIEKAVLPNSVKTIGNALWLSCQNLQSIYLPESITTLTKNLCSYCEDLREISIHGKIESINDEWCLQNKNQKVTIYFDETKNEALLNWLTARKDQFEGVSLLSAEVVTEREQPKGEE